MITTQELELLAQLLARAGVNPYEAAWANQFLDRLRSMVLTAEAESRAEAKTEADDGELPADPAELS